MISVTYVVRIESHLLRHIDKRPVTLVSYWPFVVFSPAVQSDSGASP